MLRRGVEREIEIIGEATNRILKLDEKIKTVKTTSEKEINEWIAFCQTYLNNIMPE